MSIVVTGATGPLGHLVVEKLIARGVAPESILAVGRRLERIEDLSAQGVSTAAVSFDDPASLDEAFAGVETVLLVSGSEVGRRVPQHLAVIEAAKRAGVGRLVYTSAPRADVSELVLAPEHKATEEALVASGLVYTIVRNNWYSENYADVVRQMASTGAYASATGDGRIASATREDYAEGAAVVLSTEGHDGAVYEFSGDVAWTFEELGALVGDVAGVAVSVTRISPEEQAVHLSAAGLDEGTVGFVVALDAGIREGWLGFSDGTLSRLIARPTTTLADFARSVLPG